MRICLTLLAALLTAPCLAASEEPPTQLRVEIAGKAITTTAGATSEVDLGDRKVRVRVEELPWRHFREGSLQFDYPRHLAWEFDAEPPRSWTLDGNSDVIMLFDNTAGELDTTRLAADIDRSLKPRQPPKRRAVTWTTAKAGTLEGIASTLQIGPATIEREYYRIDKGAAQWLLSLQDTLDDAGAHSAEYHAMRARLAATLEF